MFKAIHEVLRDSNSLSNSTIKIEKDKHEKKCEKKYDKKQEKKCENNFEQENEKYVINNVISNIGNKVNTLEKNTFFKQVSETNIYTNKNISVGAEKNLGDVNLYVETISVNRIIQAIKLYYNSIIICNDLINQILNNEEKIRNEGFITVLEPYVTNTYYENSNYFQILTLPSVSQNNTKFNNNKILYTYKKYQSYSGKTLEQLKKLDDEKKQVYYGGELDDFTNIFNSNFLNMNQYIQIGSNRENYFFIAPKFNNSYEMIFSCGLKLPGIFSGIDGVNPDYVIIQSSVCLEKILIDINQQSLLSSEYIAYFNRIVNTLSNIQATYNNLKLGIFSNLINYDLWEYNTILPSLSICKYSTLFQDWINKPANEIVILGSDLNIAKILTDIIKFNNKNLLLNSDGQVGFIQYSYNNEDFLIITKLIILDNIKYIIITEINLNDFFTEAIKTNGDLTIEGTLSVNNWDTNNVFNLRTVDKTLQVNGKIGINTKNPNALLDIEGITTLQISNLTNSYTELNKFIFGYYDYFINNFSNTPNRNFDEIYSNYLGKEKISVSTIDLPFDFDTTTSSNETFNYFIENFNEYIYFNLVESSYIKYQDQVASEITDPYFQNYFNYIKNNFLILWNQKKYYRLVNYQTFTKIVNYFAGPVIQMQVIWYDKDYNKLRVFASYLKRDEILLNKELNEILTNYYDSLFSCEQLTNLFSNLLKDPIIEEKQLNNPLFLTNYVNNSFYKQRFGYPQNYIFCYEFKKILGEEKYLFHELFNYWADNKPIKLQIPNQDILVSGALLQINNYINNNFDTSIIERMMICIYFWQFEYKVSYVKIINIQDKKYVIGSGVDILTYVKKNIISNGDHQFNGSLKLIEVGSNQTVITMDTTKKQVAIQYPVGLGTENPRSLLTIDDVSITNLFDYLDELSRKNRYISDLAKELNNQPVSNYKNIIENYIDPFTGSLYKQDIDNYFSIINPGLNINNILNYQFNYHWYLKTWTNVLYKDVLNPNFDPINKDIKKIVGDNFIMSPTIFIIFYQILNLKIYNWVWGKKILTKKYFKDQNEQLKCINIGINFNNYFTRFNSNKNLQNIIYAVRAIQLYLNELYLSYNGLEPININELTPFLNQTKKEYTKYSFGVIDYPNDFNQTRIYLNQNGDIPTNLNDLKPTDTIYNILYNYESSYHGNLTFEQVLIYYQKIIDIHQKITFYNGKESQLSLNDSNIIGYRTDENYWIAAWMYLNIKTYDYQSKNVLAIYEFNVDDYLNQSIQMIGDLQMAGNLTLMNPKEYLKYVKNELPLSSLNPLISIYPEEEFMGIGSQKIYTQYVLDYNTIDKQANQVFAKNHVVVSNPFYPNLVGERIADPNQNLSFDESIKSSYSGFTVRRTTKVFTLEDIVNQGDGKFGIDISYEIQDKFDDTYEMAESGVQIIGLKEFDNGLIYPVPKYFWNIIDNATNINTIQKKTLMELDNTGRLTVNKIKLGDYDLEVIDNGNGSQSLKWGNIVLGTQPNQ